MADPFSIVTGSLTVADSSKKVIDVCTDYLSHAKNAPKEFQNIIEDIHDLVGTIKKLESFSKSKEGSSELNQGFDQWHTPLKRLDGYAKDLVKIIERQDLKIALFHELGFRTRWPTAWREVQALLVRIERGKSKLHLAVALDGAGYSRKVYMLVDERLPEDMHTRNVTSKVHSQISKASSICWRSPPSMPPAALADTIRTQIGDFTGYRGLSQALELQDNIHELQIKMCGERTCEVFLNSNAYQGWKNRKTRRPSLLYVSGSVATGKSILCSQVIQDLQNSYGTEVGVAYCYVDSIPPEQITSTWMFQLALQCSCVPLGSGRDNVLQKNLLANDSNSQQGSLYRRHHESLLQALFSILPKFRRTYIIVDGFESCAFWTDELGHRRTRAKEELNIIPSLLEQDFGNVSIAIFSRIDSSLDPITDLADVSIRLLKAEPSSDTLHEYCRSRVERKVKPELVIAGFRQPEVWLDDIERAICNASDGLYLAVDMFIDSTVEALRDGVPIGAYLSHIRENSEIMMQRDPEIMKQKNFGPNVPDPEARSGTVRKDA